MRTSFLDRLGPSRREDIEETIAGSTPLLAAVGAGDLALERLRAARSELGHRAASFDPKALREQAQASLADGMDALQSEMMAAPEQLKALPEKAQEWPARAQSLMADLVSAALSTYGELAGRGQTVLDHPRGVERADAHGADVEGAYVKEADVEDTDVKEADVEGAYVEGAHVDVFADDYSNDGGLPLTRPTIPAVDPLSEPGAPDGAPVSQAAASDGDAFPLAATPEEDAVPSAATPADDAVPQPATPEEDAVPSAATPDVDPSSQLRSPDVDAVPLTSADVAYPLQATETPGVASLDPSAPVAAKPRARKAAKRPPVQRVTDPESLPGDDAPVV